MIEEGLREHSPFFLGSFIALLLTIQSQPATQWSLETGAQGRIELASLSHGIGCLSDIIKEDPDHFPLRLSVCVCFLEDVGFEGSLSSVICRVMDLHLLLKHALRPLLSILNKTWVFLNLPSLTFGRDVFS